MNFRSYFKIAFYLFISFVCLSASCQKATKSQSNVPSKNVVAWYNVENLFDVVDDPKINDEDFTPLGKLKWTKDRYQIKLDRIAQAIDTLPGALPAIVGLCEIENKKVLEDLVSNKRIKKTGYKIIHQDSKDERGIDVALLYDPKRIKIENFEYYNVPLPRQEDKPTRDILYVHAKMCGESIHLFLNHWPSRSGGEAESEPKRIAAAEVLRSKLEMLLSNDPSAAILVMGDFNDYPTNRSINEVVKAGTLEEGRFYNFMLKDCLDKKGTYFYKGEWTMLDQFFGSMSLVNGQGKLMAQPGDSKIFKNPVLCFTDKDGNLRPNRTYVGEDYKGGYSDHLPIYIEVTCK